MRKLVKDHPVRAFLYAFVFISEVFLGLRMYEVLDKTSDAIQAWAVTILAGITAYYAVQTKAQADASVKMAEEAEEARFGQYRPILEFQSMRVIPASPLGRQQTDTALAPSLGQPLSNFAFDYKFLDLGGPLEIRNIGTGPALDITLSAVDVQSHRFSCKIPIIGAGEKLQQRLLPWAASEEGGTAHPSLTAFYKDVFRRTWVTKEELTYDDKTGAYVRDKCVTEIIET